MTLVASLRDWLPRVSSTSDPFVFGLELTRSVINRDDSFA